MSIKNYTPIDDLIAVSQPKEGEPSLRAAETAKIQEVVEHETVDEKAGPLVEIRPETIKLSPKLENIGLQASQTSKFTSYKNIELPISDDKILVGLHAPITSSLRWLATLAVYFLRQAHLTLKFVHGHAVRMMKR